MIALLLALQAVPDVTAPVVRTPTVSTSSAPVATSVTGGTLLGCFWEKSPQEHALDGFAIFLPEGWNSGPFDPANLYDPAGFLKDGQFQRVVKERSEVKFSSVHSTLALTPTGGGLFAAILVTGRESREGVCQAGEVGDRTAAYSFFDRLRAGIDKPEEAGQ